MISHSFEQKILCVYLESLTETSELNEGNIPPENSVLSPYSKMAQVGVPIAAIVQKMRAQGIKDEEVKLFIKQQTSNI